MRNAESVLAHKVFGPELSRSYIASSKEAYDIVASSSHKIIYRSPVGVAQMMNESVFTWSFFGTQPIGLTSRLEKGMLLYGPLIRPRSNSLDSMLPTM